MPRISRKNSKSCFYHVMVQGINKEHIFSESKYKAKYKKFMLDKLDGSNITILAYCLMINHVHILVYTENIDDLSTYMHKVNVCYSMYYNKINSRVGYVFRDRYRSQEILSQRQLYTCLRYIHNNPVKAGIVSKPGYYYYSSYNEFFKERIIINSASIEKLFGTVDDYIEKFNKVHCFFDESEEDEFIEEKINLNEYIHSVKQKYGMTIENLKKDKVQLEYFIKDVKKQTNASFRDLASVLEISKTKVEVYYKK